ncbi:DUF3040 domain-containing protein [Streptomyces qinglanensis]|uniref:DUF3040 domain-containing protein n=1 Tax=Streptomyces qinglanensis TaxID=943816 RepID=A0A1H9NHJ3_9ACTN|nr:DUF3040 domain-containing protein [Streptomyces qinglanensis]SER34853.1 Protein of unknown function [Streptomyces qinglanensis]
MPLSEHEQRMLEQMERALYAEDPKFATALEGSELRRYTRKRVYQAVAGFLVGIALLMAGMVAQQIWISVVGFLVMLGCAVLAVTGWRKAPKQGEEQAAGQGGASQGSGAARRQQPRNRRSVMSRIEERWQRRRDEGHH